MNTSTRPLPDHSEPGLQRTPLERCAQYGIQILPGGDGFYAFHVRGGATSTYTTKEGAAAEACAKWDL